MTYSCDRRHTWSCVFVLCSSVTFSSSPCLLESTVWSRERASDFCTCALWDSSCKLCSILRERGMGGEGDGWRW